MTRVSPLEVESFLHNNGWTQAELRPGICATWVNTQLDASLLLPYATSYRDFRQRLAEALETIAEVYGYHGDEFALQIRNSGNGLVFMRPVRRDPDESIPLQEAIRLLDGMSQIMLLAACSAISPQLWNPGRRPEAATRFIHHDLSLVLTLRDGFVMTIVIRHGSAPIVPLPRAPEPESFRGQTGPTDADGSPRPFTRRAVETCARGLDAIRVLLEPEAGISRWTTPSSWASAPKWSRRPAR